MKNKLLAIMSLSLGEVENMHWDGRLEDRVFEAYVRIWKWTAVRWSNVHNADQEQERFWQKYGKEAFYRKINKTRQAFGFEPIKV